MHETSKLVYRVSEADVIRARNQHQRRLYSSVASNFYSLHTDASVCNNFPDSIVGSVFRDTEGSVIWFKSTVLAGVHGTHLAEFYSVLIGVRFALLTLIVRKVKDATLVVHMDRLDVYKVLSAGVVSSCVITVEYKRVDRKYNQEADGLARIVLQSYVEEKWKRVASVDWRFECHIHEPEVLPYFCGDVTEVVLIDGD
ncbi:hypothetical protein V6N13_061555 [Hibiscus sabdariffa]